MDNIEELAPMIQITHRVDPITGVELPDGRFMVISGHRRRLARLYRYEHGMSDTDLPTVVQSMVNDFTEADITDDEIETLNVVFPNKGSRRNLTPTIRGSRRNCYDQANHTQAQVTIGRARMERRGISKPFCRYPGNIANRIGT